jgi:hypothetical protein
MAEAAPMMYAAMARDFFRAHGFVEGVLFQNRVLRAQKINE